MIDASGWKTEKMRAIIHPNKIEGKDQIYLLKRKSIRKCKVRSQGLICKAQTLVSILGCILRQ